MSFISSGWLALYILIPIIMIGAILVHTKRNKAWKSIVAPRLQKHLVREGSQVKTWFSIASALLGAALLITALARPYKGVTRTVETISSRNIIIAIDTSRSMLVRDGSPDRMTSAKAISLEMIESFPEDRIGIIAFSGLPLLMAPLTVDHAAVQETISQLDTDVIPSGGSNIARAIMLANKTFEKTNQKSNAVIIISDGEDLSPEANLAAQAIRDAEIKVCTIGVGSTEGGIIPDYRTRDGKFRDYRGKTVHSKLIPEALEKIASIGNGSYLAGSSGADRVIKRALSSINAEEGDNIESSVPNERYEWFLIPAIFLLLLSMVLRAHLFKPSLSKLTQQNSLSAVSIILGAVLCYDTASANNHIEAAKKAYQSNDYQAALDAFGKAIKESPKGQHSAIAFSQGSSAYRLKEWELAGNYFSQALFDEKKSLQQEAHYNLANSLFYSGWETLNPENSDQGAQPNTQHQPNPSDQLNNAALDAIQKTDHTQQKINDMGKVISLWEDAISHYEATLKLSAEHKNAEANLALVKEELEKLKQEKEQQEQQQQQEQEQQKGEEEQEQESEDGENQDQEGENGDQEQESEDGEDQEGEENQEGDDSEGDEGEQSDQQGQQSQSDQEADMEEGETSEEFAARVLEEQSDLETKPRMMRRFGRFRRTANDW